MSRIQLKYTERFVKSEELFAYADRVRDIHKRLHSIEEYDAMPLGWLDAPMSIDDEEISRILESANRIRKLSDIIISLGIGGSYLGSLAAIEMLGNPFDRSIKCKGNPEIVFAGNNLSGFYLKSLIEKLEGKDFSICVISKSGTTLETSLAFRILRNILEDKYGKDEAKNRIIAITDKSKGILRKLADDNSYESFAIPENVGGRYSVLTAAGLYTIAAAGLDIEKMIQGGKDAYNAYNNEDIEANYCYQYAALRNIFYDKGKRIEVLASYEPSLIYLSEWWKQLFGESEGKEARGIFPVSLQFTRDLHSMGQYLQEGPRNMFETVIKISKARGDLTIPFDRDDIDGLNYLTNKTVNKINDLAYEAVKEAHEDGDIPIISLEIPEQNEYYFGYLSYFFQKACAVSGYILGVNPFDQPGVERYKSNINRRM